MPPPIPGALGPEPVGTGVNVPSSGRMCEAVPRQVEVADDLGPQQAHDVGGDREPEARDDLLGDRRPAQQVPALEDDDAPAGPSEVGGRDEAVVAAADHDGVVGLGHPGKGTQATPGARARTRRCATVRR